MGVEPGAGSVRQTLSITDPGPLARLREVIADPMSMSIIVQRLTDGETLKEIAKVWQVPYGKLAEWVVEDRERSEKYNAALKIWADSLAQECVAIADEQEAVTKANGQVFDPDVQRDKLRIETRLKLAGKWNRGVYGDATEVKHTGSVSLVALLSGIPRQEIDVTPPAALPAAEVPAEKNPEKTTNSEEALQI